MLAAAQALPELDFHFVGGKEDEIAFWRGEVTRLNLANAFFPGRVPHREIPLLAGGGGYSFDDVDVAGADDSRLLAHEDVRIHGRAPSDCRPGLPHGLRGLGRWPRRAALRTR